MCKLINNNNVQFTTEEDGFITEHDGKIIVHSKMGKDYKSFIHEFGHFADRCYFDDSLTMSYSYNLYCNKTLNEIIKEEVNLKGDKICNTIIKKCEQLITNKFCKARIEKIKKYSDSLSEKTELEQTLDSYFVRNVNYRPNLISKDRLSKDESKYFDLCYQSKKMQNYLTKTLEAIYPIYSEYLILIDAIEHKYSLYYPYKIKAHGKSYFDKNEGLVGNEFFANMFKAELLNDEKKLLKVYDGLPISYNAFYSLLEILINKYSTNCNFVPYGKQIIIN